MPLLHLPLLPVLSLPAEKEDGAKYPEIPGTFTKTVIPSFSLGSRIVEPKAKIAKVLGRPTQFQLGPFTFKRDHYGNWSRNRLNPGSGMREFALEDDAALLAERVVELAAKGSGTSLGAISTAYAVNCYNQVSGCCEVVKLFRKRELAEAAVVVLQRAVTERPLHYFVKEMGVFDEISS